MASRLTVIFFIVLCLEAGIFLTVLPWWQPWGMGGWGDNFFLVYAAHKFGTPGLQHAVSSGWVRGAVTGLGLLNMAMAFWEMFHFKETVRRLQGFDNTPRAAGCDGVQLTARSLEASVVRRAFGPDFLVGVSTHALQEARAARDAGADFAVFGPVFDTPSKRQYGPPLGLEHLREAARALAPLPLVAVGGINEENAREVLRAGARGVAAIRLFADGQNLARTVHLIEGLGGH